MPAALEVPDFQQGKLSQAEYQQRCASSTSQQLSLLLTSPEYQQWFVQRSRTTQPSAARSKSWSWLPALATVFLLALAMSPWLAQLSRQQVTVCYYKKPEHNHLLLHPGQPNLTCVSVREPCAVYCGQHETGFPSVHLGLHYSPCC